MDGSMTGRAPADTPVAGRPRPRRRLLSLLAVLTMLAGSVSMGLLTAAPQAAAEPTTGAVTKKVEFPATETTPVSTGSVTVSKTTGLQRERVAVNWTDFLPTKEPNAEARSQYGVAIMQCRGHTPVREECYYGTVATRVIRNADALENRNDANYRSGAAVPFVDLDGKSYELTDNGVGGYPNDWKTYPVSGVYSSTNADGTGRADFEVRTGDEHENTLGCGRVHQKTKKLTECSLVVVPIRELKCRALGTDSPANQKRCLDPANATHRDYVGQEVALTQSNWRNRFVFPLSFLPPDGLCELNSKERLPTAGSELLATAMYRWIPALCGREQGPLPVTYSPMAEGEARRQYEHRGQDLVGVNRPVPDPNRKTAYAPAAVSGFGIAFNIDNDDLRNQTVTPVTELKLNARLVAKLVTESYRGLYPAEVMDPGHLRGNPATLLDDPEFLALNQQIKPTPKWAMATMITGSGDGDIPHALTQWLVADPEALAFLRGEPDQWGQRINPAHRGIAVPFDQFQSLDGYAPKAPNPCKDTAKRCELLKKKLHELLVQQFNSIREIGADVVAAWPRITTEPKQAQDPGPVTFPRVEAQPVRARAVIGLTDLATAARYRLPLAKLSTGARNADGSQVFAGPSNDSLGRALRSTKLDEKTGTLELDYEKLEPGAYPGTMVTYAAVTTEGMDKSKADRYAQLIEYGAGPGQNYGSGVGDLPPGYYSLPAKLQEQARLVAKAVREQKGEVPKAPFEDPKELVPGGPGATAGGGEGVAGTGGTGGTPADSANANTNAGGGAAGANAPNAAAPGGVAAPNPAAPTTTAGPTSANIQAVADTRSDRAGWIRWALPIVLGLGLLAGVAVPLAVVGAQPGHPVRRGLAGAAAKVASVFRRSRS